MRRVLVYLVALSALFVYMRADAAVYQWYHGTAAQGLFSSPLAACQSYIDKNSKPPGTPDSYHMINPRVSPVTATSWNCYVDQLRTNVDGSYGSTYREQRVNVYRVGDSCDGDDVYNADTGQCESDDPCGDKTGDSFNFSISGVGSTDYMYISESGKFSAPAQTGCFNGCSASTVDQSCQVRSLGPWRCGGVAVYTGAECGEGETSVENSESLEKPSSETVTNKQDCNYITGPDGSQTCTSVSELEKKGQVCGTFNGETICPDIQPELDRTQVDTTVTTEDNGDGTTTTTKTDTATVTNCTGASCNTSTTTNTTVTNGGSTTSTCTGAQCPSSGNPDGDGDGFGDCVGDCDGGVGPLGLEGQGEGTSFGDTLADYQNRISNSPIASAVTSISMPSNGSCSFPTASTYLFDVDLNFICQNANWLDPLRFVFLAIWGFAAVRVLMSA